MTAGSACSKAVGKRPRVIVLLALIVLGAALRFSVLNARSFWVDEAATVMLLRLDFLDMLRAIPGSEGAPPVYYVVAWLWCRLFGTGEAGVRSLSALAGTATIPVTYLAAVRLISTRAGLTAAILAAVSPMLVWFSLDARAYVFLVLLGGMSFLYFVEYLIDRSRRSVALWTVSSMLALATHYYAFFLIAPEALWLLVVSRPRRTITPALGCVAVCGLALVPLILAQRHHGGRFIGLTPWLPRLLQAPANFLVGFQPPFPVATSVTAIILVSVALGLLLVRSTEHERAGARVAAIVGSATVTAPVLLSLVPSMDFLLARNLAAAWVPLAVVVAAGFSAVRAGALGNAALGGYCALSIAINVATADISKFEHEDWRAAATAVGPDHVARAIVLTPNFGTIVFRIYRPALRSFTAAAASVEEVVVIGLPPSFRRIGSPSLPPRLLTTHPAPSGFTLTESIAARTFTLARYRANEPRRVTAEELTALALSKGKIGVLIE